MFIGESMDESVFGGPFLLYGQIFVKNIQLNQIGTFEPNMPNGIVAALNGTAVLVVVAADATAIVIVVIVVQKIRLFTMHKLSLINLNLHL